LPTPCERVLAAVMIRGDGPSAPLGGEASMEAAIGIALVVISVVMMVVISRTVIANTPKA
jgi:hypothetical protein